MAYARLYFPLILCVWLGFFLRIHALHVVPLRGDEAFSAQYWAGMPLRQSLAEIAPKDPHPPLAFASFRLWRHLLGGTDSVFALRFFSVLGNIIGVASSFALGWRLSRSRTLAFFAALMWALHPFEIWHSQDFRNYAIWAGASVTAVWLCLRLIQGGTRADWWAYGLTAVAAALIFYTEVTLIVSLALCALWQRRSDKSFLRRLLALQAAILSLAAACFFVLQAEPIVSGSYGGNLNPFAPADYVSRFVPALALGEPLPFAPETIGAALTALLTLAALSLWRGAARQLRFLLTLLLLPLLLLGIVSLFRNVFHPRYVLAAAPACILLLAAGAFHAALRLEKRLKLPREALTALLLLPWFALAAYSLNAYYAGFDDPERRKSPAWDELGAFLSARAQADDLVIQLSADAAFGYYYRGIAPDIALPTHPEQTAEELQALLAGHSAAHRSLFVAARSNPAWQNQGLVEAWMRANMQEVLAADANGLPIWQYMPWRVPLKDKAERARFADTVALAAAEFMPEPLPSAELLLWLTWKPLAADARGIKSFVHVYGAAASASQLWSQDDQYPQRGRLSSADWKPGELFRDVYYLPVDALAAGEYRIVSGWYDPATGVRLLTADGGDTATIAQFHFPAGKSAAE